MNQQELIAENRKLKARVTELEDGFSIALDDMDQDLPRFHALFAVLDGVVKSVAEYDNYLKYQLDGGAP